MADETPEDAREEDTPMRTEEDDADSASDSGSGSGSGSDDEEEEQTEWLVTSRAKRSTAGNRLNALLQQEDRSPEESEDPDDELLNNIFLSDDDDAGYEDAAADQSDVQMDSSSDDEDHGPAAGADDDLEGEKEIQRQAKAERQARQRRLRGGIPKMRRKVRIDTSTSTQAAAARPKKKSERASWIPTAEDAPQRASARGTTQLQKRQLHEQMVEREIKRQRQVLNMERAAAAKEAAKAPALTQEDRYKEARRVEKANSRSLNRWQEDELAREEEQRAKLAALHNRTLKGPVITYWSGIAEYFGGKLKKVATREVHEKEKVGRKKKVVEVEEDPVIGEAPKDGKTEEAAKDLKADSQDPLAKPEKSQTLLDTATDSRASPVAKDSPQIASAKELLETAPAEESTPAPAKESPPVVSAKESPAPEETEEPAAIPSPLEEPAPESPAPVSPPVEEPTPESPPVEEPVRPLPEPPRQSFVLAAPVGFGAPIQHAVLPPPPPIVRPSVPTPPVSTTPPIANTQQTYHHPTALSQPTLDGSTPVPGLGSFGSNFLPNLPANLPRSQIPFNIPPHQRITPQPREETPPPPPSPITEHSNRNYIILSNFDDDKIKDKDIQTRVLFNRVFQKLKKPKNTPELCAITSQPARYRDPATGLPYANAFAYKEIQKLKRCEYKWSALAGAYVGAGERVARGVPGKFVDGGFVKEGDVEGGREGAKEVEGGS